MVASAFESPFSDENIAEARRQADLITGKTKPPRLSDLTADLIPATNELPGIAGTIVGEGVNLGVPIMLARLPGTKAAAGIKGAAKGAAKASTEMVEYGPHQIKIPIPAPIAGAAAGGLAGHYAFDNPMLGAAVGATAPVVKGAVAGAKSAMKKFTTAAELDKSIQAKKIAPISGKTSTAPLDISQYSAPKPVPPIFKNNGGPTAAAPSEPFVGPAYPSPYDLDMAKRLPKGGTLPTVESTMPLDVQQYLGKGLEIPPINQPVTPPAQTPFIGPRYPTPYELSLTKGEPLSPAAVPDPVPVSVKKTRGKAAAPAVIPPVETPAAPTAALPAQSPIAPIAPLAAAPSPIPPIEVPPMATPISSAEPVHAFTHPSGSIADLRKQLFATGQELDLEGSPSKIRATEQIRAASMKIFGKSVSQLDYPELFKLTEYLNKNKKLPTSLSDLK
jgi:hypothetical protein